MITGSSNLTAAGLGTEEAQRNYEFNVLLHDFTDVKFAGDEFEALWNESIEVLPEAVRGVVRQSYLRGDITPFELYIKSCSNTLARQSTTIRMQKATCLERVMHFHGGRVSAGGAEEISRWC